MKNVVTLTDNNMRKRDTEKNNLVCKISQDIVICLVRVKHMSTYDKTTYLYSINLIGIG